MGYHAIAAGCGSEEMVMEKHRGGKITRMWWAEGRSALEMVRGDVPRRMGMGYHAMSADCNLKERFLETVGIFSPSYVPT